MQLSISKAALFDMAEAYQWYEGTRPGLGDDFTLCVEEALSIVGQIPEAFQQIRTLLVHRYAMHRFPYVIYYTIGKQEAQIEAVIHSSRHPSVWQMRIRH